MERHGSHGNDFRIIAEKSDDMRRENPAETCTAKEKDEADLHREPIGLAQPGKELGTIAETADRLEPLTETDDERHDHHRDAVDDGHARNGRIPISASRMVEQHH